MYQSLSEFILPVVVTLLGVITISLYLHLKVSRAKARTVELDVVKQSMLKHYEAMSKIIDDPALPLPAVEFLCGFSHIIADRKISEDLILELLGPDEPSISRSAVSEAMDKISETRPDLYENYTKALLNGLAVMTLRWPGHSADFAKIFTPLVGDHKKEARTVRMMTSLPRNDVNFLNGNHAHA